MDILPSLGQEMVFVAGVVAENYASSREVEDGDAAGDGEVLGGDVGGCWWGGSRWHYGGGITSGGIVRGGVRG